MKPFVYKSFIGNFFDVLQSNDEQTGQRGASYRLGGTRKQEAVISIFAGDFDLDALPEFGATLDTLLTQTVQLAVVDLSRVKLFSANAAAVLVNFLAGVEGRGKRLVLYRPSESVRDMLTSLGLPHLFETQETEEELLLDLPD